MLLKIYKKKINILLFIYLLNNYDIQEILYKYYNINIEY